MTRNLLLAQLREWGIKISEGQLNNILLKNKEVYHREKADILAAGCRSSSYLQANEKLDLIQEKAHLEGQLNMFSI